jgi:hypothetical protein
MLAYFSGVSLKQTLEKSDEGHLDLIVDFLLPDLKLLPVYVDT